MGPGLFWEPGTEPMESAELVLIFRLHSPGAAVWQTMATTCRQPLRPSSDHRYRSPATHRIPIDSSMKKITRYIRQLTVKTPNSSAQTHARHQDRVSPTHSNTTLPLPPRSTRRSTHRGPSTQSRSEGPLIRDARWIGEELTNRGRRTSSAQNPATNAN